MEPPILSRLEKDFGDRGVRAAQFLRTAETLIASPPSAARIGEVIAYCVREALVEIPRTSGVEEGQWKHVSRSVVEARTRYELARGLVGMHEEQALEDLLKSVYDLEAVHNSDSIHVVGLRRLIRSRTGVDPLTHNAHALDEYQKLVREVQNMVHAAGPAIALEAAGTCYKRALSVLSRLFLIDPRIERLRELAALDNPTDADGDALHAHLITSHDSRFFASLVSSPAWLDVMLDKGLLELPQDPSEMWPAAMILGRLRQDHGAALADWLEKAWARWFPTEVGLIALAAAAREAGQHGRAVLLRCLQSRPHVPQICRLAAWESNQMDAKELHVETFADLLLNPGEQLDRYEKERIAEKIVAGMNPANGLDRVTLLVHKLGAHVTSEKFFYLDDHASIADSGEEWRHDVVWTLIRALITALGKAIDLRLSTGDLLRAIERLPQPVQDHIQAWVRTNTKDIECPELIEFVVKAIQERRPTGDDLLLVDAIVDRFKVDAAANVWREALGRPPDPVTLGTDIRQDPLPEDLIRRWFWSVVLPAEVVGSWGEVQTVMASAHRGIDRDYFLRPRSRVTPMSGPNTPFDAADLKLKSPQEVAELIAAWKPTTNDSWELRSARGIGRQLEEIVKENPRRWADSPVEMVARLRHPTYVAHFFTGLAAEAESLGDIGDHVIRAIDFARTHPWPVEPLGGDAFEYDHDWGPADEAGVALIKALAEKHIPLEVAATERVWAIAITATRDRGEPSSLLGDDDDPLTYAINRPCTRALDTVGALVDYEYKRSGTVPSEALTLLTESLALGGRDGREHRAILGPKIPFLRHVLPDWFDENLDLLLGDTAPPGLAQETIDLWLRWGRADEWMLREFRSQILDAVHRGSRRALEGFLLGLFWDLPSYDAASCVHDLVGLGPEHLSTSGETVARMVQSDDTPSDLVQRGIALWEEALRVEPGPAALQGFGWWAEVSAVDTERWERLTLGTCEQAGGNIAWAPRVAERASSRPASPMALRILTLLVRAPLENWDSYQVAEHALKALADSPADSSVAEAWDELRRALLEHGHFEAQDAQ